MEEAFRCECDICGTMVDVAEIIWDNGGAICVDCAEDQVEEVFEVIPEVFYTPVYGFYNALGSLLHLSLDIESPKQWKNLMGPNWWFYDVVAISIHFFDNEEEATIGLDELVKNRCPLFVRPEEKVEYTTKPKIYGNSGNTRTVSLSARVSEDIDEQITRKCLELHISRGDFYRHALVKLLND